MRQSPRGAPDQDISFHHKIPVPVKMSDAVFQAASLTINRRQVLAGLEN